MKPNLQIEHLGFIATLNNGNTHQVFVSKANTMIILGLIKQLEKGIKLLDPPLEGIILTERGTE